MKRKKLSRAIIRTGKSKFYNFLPSSQGLMWAQVIPSVTEYSKCPISYACNPDPTVTFKVKLPIAKERQIVLDCPYEMQDRTERGNSPLLRKCPGFHYSSRYK